MSVADPVREAPLDAAPVPRRLLVAWQHPLTRAFDLIGSLDLPAATGDPYRFRYFEHARKVPDFRPFVDMPELAAIYESSEPFPVFQNRMTPRTRSDYPDVAASVGLTADADPFEVLARTGGRRATDTVEVFAEPLVDPVAGELRMKFLVRGIRHIEGVQDVIDRLEIGDRLRVMCDAQNPTDALALTLADGQAHTLGWIPRYLAPTLHCSSDRFGWTQIAVEVEHIGDRHGPPHLRLLCHLRARWDPSQPPFEGSGPGIAEDLAAPR